MDPGIPHLCPSRSHARLSKWTLELTNYSSKSLNIFKSCWGWESLPILTDLILKVVLNFMYVHMCVHVNVQFLQSSTLVSPRDEVTGTYLSHLLWVLGVKLRPSARAVNP